jgi:hypothetical protein
MQFSFDNPCKVSQWLLALCEVYPWGQRTKLSKGQLYSQTRACHFCIKAGDCSPACAAFPSYLKQQVRSYTPFSVQAISKSSTRSCLGIILVFDIMSWYNFVPFILGLVQTSFASKIFQPNCSTIPAGTNFVYSPDIRGTQNILWSCIFTIIACTWTIQHLNVPRQRGK